jgi:thiol-disulfide isomerase/thioredoxin
MANHAPFPEQSNQTNLQTATRWHLGRRQIVLGIATSFGLIATRSRALAQETKIPNFQSERYQFTILRPQESISSTRLFRIDGKTTDLLSLRGKPILLNFWATWCPACRIELPILDRLLSDRRHAGLQILAISEGRDERAAVELFVNKLKIRNLPIYLDPNNFVAFTDIDNARKAPFALYGMPITYAIAASGWIVGYIPGAVDWNSSDADNLIKFLFRS